MYSNRDGTFVSYETWAAALASSACIGLTSLVPWLFNMTFFERRKDMNEVEKGAQEEDGRMKFLLSFALGAILGDIFFHLIPESLHSHIFELEESIEDAYRQVGLSILSGIFVFIIMEMVLERWSHSDEKETTETLSLNLRINDELCYSKKNDEMPIFTNGDLKKTIKTHIESNNNSQTILENNNNHEKNLESLESAYLEFNQNLKTRSKGKHLLKPSETSFCKYDHDLDQMKKVPDLNRKERNLSGCQIVETAGYLNLIANGFDNFTHGLAIGASFMVGPKVGLLTTFVIIIHEIPHEICDYAILVNSGFSRLEAVKAQSSVALFGVLGTATALYVKSIQNLNAQTVWILPFSAGGFLYIALVNLLPEILDQETNFLNTIGQIACVILGIAFMAVVAII